MLIRFLKKEQNAQKANSTKNKHKEDKKVSSKKTVIAIVGSTTCFGRWFWAFLSRFEGISLLLPEPEYGITVKEVVQQSDIIIFAVPPAELEKTISQYNEADLPLSKLWIDVGMTNVPASESLRDVVADAVSLRFDEPTEDLIECVHLPEEKPIYIYTLTLGCSNVNFTHFFSALQNATGVKNIQFVRPRSSLEELDEAV